MECGWGIGGVLVKEHLITHKNTKKTHLACFMIFNMRDVLVNNALGKDEYKNTKS